jgi:hypothetical protein
VAKLPGLCVPFRRFVYVPEIFYLMTQKGAPSKDGQRKKNAAGWDSKALIEKGGRTKYKITAEDLRHAAE